MEFCLGNVLCELLARVRVGNPGSDLENRTQGTSRATGCFESLDRLDRILKSFMNKVRSTQL